MLNVSIEEVLARLTPSGKLEFELAQARASLDKAIQRLTELEAELAELKSTTS